MLRRCAAASRAALAFAAARREIAVFTEQSEVLANNAKHKKYTSNLWVEVDDAWWTKSVSAVKAGEEATQAPIQRRIELYNVDQLAKRPDGLDNRAVHSSVRTMAPYSAGFQDELELRSKTLNFASKWWMSEREIEKRKLELRRNARPVAVLVRTTARLLNADQFEKAQEIARIPFSGATKKPYTGPMGELLKKDIAQHNYPTGLYFTVKQLELFGLADQVKAGAVPLEHAIQREHRMIYNVDELVNGEAIVKSLNRSPVETDTYLVSGHAVGDTLRAKCQALAHKSKYWIGDREVQQHGYGLLPTAKGVPFGADFSTKLSLFSVHQLTNPSEGFKRAGTRVA